MKQELMTPEQEAQMHQQLKEQQTANRDLANRLLGQAEMAQGIAQISTIYSLKSLQQVKEQKLYREFKGQKRTLANGKEVDLGTWEGYCSACGTSARAVDEQLANADAFGLEAAEHLQNMGIGRNDLRLLRKLPDEQQDKLIEQALASGNKAELKALIAEQASELSQQKALIEQELESAKTDLEVQRQLSTEKQQQLDELKENKFRLQPWQNEAKDAATAMMEAQAQIMEGMQALYSIGQQLAEGDVIDNRAQDPLSHILLNITNETMQQAAAVYRDSCQEFPAIANAPKTTLGALEELGFDLIGNEG